MDEIENKKTFAVFPKRIIFISVFSLLFCFSFIFSILTHFQYRAAVVSLLVLPLVILYGIKLDRVLLAYFVLVGVILISAVYNHSSLSNLVLFLRIPVFSYLIYYLVFVSQTTESITPIVKASVWIAVLQLPILILQWQIYPYIPLEWRGNAALVDFGSGSFNYKTDYAMAFFLVLIVIFLLFGNFIDYSKRIKFMIALWLSLTVFITNSQIMKISMLIVWVAFTIRYLSVKNLLLITGGIIVVGILLAIAYQSNLLTEDITTFIDRVSGDGDVETYLQGGYSRFGALQYYLTDGFTLIGEGPLAFSDPFRRTLTRGNTGHFFQFFSEIGLFGLIASFIILFLIAFPIVNGKIYATWISILAFVSITILSFTANVMNDMAVFLIYCIVIKAGFLLANQSGAISPVLEQTTEGGFFYASTD